MSSETTTLEIARQVVMGKLYNQRMVLQQWLANVSAPAQLQRGVRRIEEMLNRAGNARSVDSLRGFEGRGGADYWGVFGAFIPRDFGFSGRKYFPPPDPINALLSFGYSLLLKDVTAAVQLVGLDPYLGFFHVIDYGRPSLSLDMMEEFRPILVDWIVLDFVQQGNLRLTDFEFTKQEKQPVRMKEPLMARLIQAYEQRSAIKVPHPDAGGQTALRRVIELQVRRLARLIQGQEKRYEPFLIK